MGDLGRYNLATGNIQILRGRKQAAEDAGAEVTEKRAELSELLTDNLREVGRNLGLAEAAKPAEEKPAKESNKKAPKKAKVKTKRAAGAQGGC